MPYFILIIPLILSFLYTPLNKIIWIFFQKKSLKGIEFGDYHISYYPTPVKMGCYPTGLLLVACLVVSLILKISGTGQELREAAGNISLIIGGVIGFTLLGYWLRLVLFMSSGSELSEIGDKEDALEKKHW